MIDDEDTVDTSTHRRRRHALHFLSNLVKSAEVFPKSLELEGVQCNLTKYVTWGGSAFIYKGEHEGNPICVKAVQFASRGADNIKKRVSPAISISKP
jgi:hypothetical protein